MAEAFQGGLGDADEHNLIWQNKAWLIESFESLGWSCCRASCLYLFISGQTLELFFHPEVVKQHCFNDGGSTANQKILGTNISPVLKNRADIDQPVKQDSGRIIFLRGQACFRRKKRVDWFDLLAFVFMCL